MRSDLDPHASFQRLDNGRPTNADDPLRGVWYSSGGSCGYWTDDWQKVANGGGIPCCPVCRCPGMQATFREWMEGAERFQAEGHPHYVEFLSFHKERCTRDENRSFMLQYDAFSKSKEQG